MSDSAASRHTGEPPSGAQPAAVVELDGSALPAFCPNLKMPIWSTHPKVFLDVAHTGSALCPYCGTQYRLKPGTVVKGGH